MQRFENEREKSGRPKETGRPEKAEEPDLTGTYTAADFINWKVDELMELIRGKVYRMTPSPSAWHQRIFSDLYTQMIKTAELRKECRVWQAPLDVYLVHPGQDFRETSNVVEPDLFIVCDPSKIHTRGCIGTPDFVVEILSPSTRKKDSSLKLELYEEYGVPEYWMISPMEKMILRYQLNEKGKYEHRPAITEEGVVSPRDFPSMKIDLEELFKDIPDE